MSSVKNNEFSRDIVTVLIHKILCLCCIRFINVLFDFVEFPGRYITETAKFVKKLVSTRKFHAQLFICNPTPAQTSLNLLSDRQ